MFRVEHFVAPVAASRRSKGVLVVGVVVLNSVVADAQNHVA